MKVIQMLPALDAGGVERGTCELGQFLVDQGHESVVISSGGRLEPRLQEEGSRHITMPVGRKHPASLLQVKPLRRLLEAEKPDILHVRSRVPAWIAYFAWRKMDPATRPKLVSTVHGFYSVNRYSRIMTRGEQVICVSNGVREYVLKNYPDTESQRLTVIHRGVDPKAYPQGWQPSVEWTATWNQQFPQFGGRFTVLLPARITRWKGHEDFVKIIAALKQQGVPVHGVVAGEPHPRKQEFYKEIQQQVSAQELAGDITFLGHRSDLKEIMASCDVTLSLSLDPEAFGRTTMEALTLGKAVAGYDHGGVHEQLTAMLPEGRVAIGDTQAMVELLAGWQQQELPTPAANTDFTLEQMLSRTLDVYHKALAEK